MQNPPVPGRDPVLELRAKFEFMQTQLQQVTGFLVAIIRQHHNGRVFVNGAMFEESINWGCDSMPLRALGTFRLTALMPNGIPAIGKDAPELPPLPPGAILVENTPGPITIEAEPETPSAPCEAIWHREAEPAGLRCPLCGSAARVEEG